jgi:phosphoglycerate dehydrogenase-like enzyme
MTVLGIDARLKTAPTGVKELHRPESLNDLLPQADFVIVTVPETPRTQSLFTKKQFQLMKSSSYFINIGRGATVSLDHLTDALNRGEISGAALDVFEVEPLPNDHALWSMPNVIITPHIAGLGPYLDQRREELFFDNCLRFNRGEMLRNIVDKKNWF